MMHVPTREAHCGGLQLKCDGTRRRTGGEVKGKLTNGVGSDLQYYNARRLEDDYELTYYTRTAPFAQKCNAFDSS